MSRLDTPIFVGRAAEQSVLRAQADAVVAGEPRVVLVTGDAGVGKSRLVAETVGHLVEHGFAAGYGSCVDIPGLEVAQVPFGPFREAARRLGGPAAASWLRPGGGTDAGSGGSDAEPAYERLAGFLDVIAAATADAPLVLVLEDLHWADRSSLALLVFLAHNLINERLLLLVTVRDQGERDGNAVEAALEHLVRQPGVTQLALGPLGEDSVRDLVAQLPVQRSQVEAVVARAEGNPLVAYELAANAGDDLQLPRSLASSVRDRLRRASGPARSALAAAAAIGTSVEHALLRRLLEVQLPGSSALEQDESVRAALATGLLRPEPGGYRFRHGLDREAVYESLLPGERQALHRAAALTLTERIEVDADLAARIAAHWRQADDPEAARRAALQAARAANAVGAYPEAMAQYQTVLDHSAGQALVDLLSEAAEAARSAGDLTRAIQMLEQAAAETAPSSSQAARIWARLGWFRREAGDDDGSVLAYERASEAIGHDPEPAAVARVKAAHARTLMLAGQLGAARARAEEALAAVRQHADEGRLNTGRPPLEPPRDAEASALVTLGTVVAMTGDPEGGLGLLARARDVAAAHGSDEERWRYVTNTVFVLHNLGRNAEAVDVALRELAAVQDRPTLPPLATGAAANAAEGLMRLGRWQEAEALLSHTIRRRPPPRFSFQLRTAWAELELLRGRPDAADEHLVALARVSATLRDPEDVANVHRLQAEAAWQRGNVDTARREVDEALVTARRNEDDETQVILLGLGLRIEADDAASPAAITAPRRAAFGEELGAVAARTTEHRPVAGLELALAQAEQRRADAEDDPSTWADVVQRAEGLDWAYPQAYAWYRSGQAALRLRRRSQAQAALTNAASLAEKLGAGWLVTATASTLAGRLADRPALDPGRSRAAELGLTERESQVLQLVAEGMTNRLIGRRLGMSEKTASVHMSRILAKLGAGTRGEAAAMARSLGLLDAVSPPEV